MSTGTDTTRAIKKAVVTGGAGFIGPHIARELRSRGFDVHCIDNLSSGKEENVPEGVTLHKVDVLDTAALIDIMQDASAVFHLAALPRVPYSIEYPLESNRVNVEGTISVLVAARDAKVGKVIYSASSSAYGDQTIMPLVETMAPNPSNPYGLQKYIGELYMKMFSETYSVKTVSLRYFNVYGPGMDPEGGYALAIPKFLSLTKAGKPITIYGDGSITRDFTHVADVVRANMLAMEKYTVGMGETINIGTGRNINVNTLADLIDGGGNAVGRRMYAAPRNEAHDTLANNNLAEELLGWTPTIQIEQGIAELKKEWEII